MCFSFKRFGFKIYSNAVQSASVLLKSNLEGRKYLSVPISKNSKADPFSEENLLDSSKQIDNFAKKNLKKR